LVDTEAVRKLVTEFGTSADGRAEVITLALVFGALEARTPKDAWRSSETGWQPNVSSADYLKFLAHNGYPLAAVEEVIAGERTSEGVYSEYCS
jgi:ParB family transcriptional regulator, chromosome partitioning protein